jgi:hypothetical protein
LTALIRNIGVLVSPQRRHFVGRRAIAEPDQDEEPKAPGHGNRQGIAFTSDDYYVMKVTGQVKPTI